MPLSTLARAIHGSQETGGILQIVLYVRGVGTTGLKLETWIEGATGIGVDDNIRFRFRRARRLFFCLAPGPGHGMGQRPADLTSLWASRRDDINIAGF